MVYSFYFLFVGSRRNECNSLWGGIRGRGQKSTTYSENISVMKFYLLTLSTMLTFFQVSLMIRWYCNLSLYMIHLSLYCRNTSFLSMRVIRCMMHISHQEYRDILELECIHSFWSQHTEKRNNTISQMRLRSVFKMRTSILNTATTEQMGYGIISFFVYTKSTNQ